MSPLVVIGTLVADQHVMLLLEEFVGGLRRQAVRFLMQGAMQAPVFWARRQQNLDKASPQTADGLARKL
jgi:hypothetical protein